MAPTLFISDLHLSADRPELVAAFHALLRGPARGAAGVYVPGDLFDAWVGDDQLREPLAARVAEAFAELADYGTPVYFQRGNRDFLIGERFAHAARTTLLPDEVVHDLHGTRTLIMHGDQLCTDDVDYQRFRAYWRDPVHQRRLLALPYFLRAGGVGFVRAMSRRATARKPPVIMDVNADAVAGALRRHGVTRMIHGHTHRPARHELVVDGRACERYVLADWYGSASYLRVDESGVVACAFAP
jgi:UDP-2,3-diacylglucosamine hydrolase